MSPDLLSPAVHSYIRQHELDDTSQLILSANNAHGVPMALIAEQIIGRRKAKEKIPTFYNGDNVVFPPSVNLEQSSSEQTAKFKSNVVLSLLPQKELCADLTGGFGVDSFFLSKVFKRVCYVEPNEDLLKIARHNHQQLGAKEIHHYTATAHEFLAADNRQFDCLYIDPSRRDDRNKKVFSFSDCVPDIMQLFPRFFEKTDHVLIKASPLLDIQKALRDLKFVKHIFVVSVENECKELLFLCEANFSDEPVIEAINLLKAGTINSFIFKRSEESAAEATFSEPLKYLYEPNASVLKAGAFKIVSQQLKIEKLHPSTHLYTANRLIKDFPGKVFHIAAHVKPDFKLLKEFFPLGQANVVTRNYPLSVKELRSKTGLKDGGDKFLVGFSGMGKKFLVVAEKLI